MGYITFYRCLIGREYEQLERFKRVVDRNYFTHCLFAAAQSAALNGMDVEELQSVLRRHLGEQYARQLKEYMEGVQV